MGIQFRITFAALVTVAALSAPAHAALVISNKPTRNVTCNDQAQCFPSAPNTVLNAGDLAALLAKHGNVNVYDYAALGIVIKAPVSLPKKRVLCLCAAGPTTIEKPVVVAGKGTVEIFGKKLTFIGKGKFDFWDLFSILQINGQRYALVGDIASLAAAISADPYGYYALAKDYDATPDGYYSGAAIQPSFHGVMEGLGHAISNFSVQFSDYVTAGGFFNGLDGTVQNFKLANVHVSVTGTNRNVEAFGALAIGSDGLVDNVSASGRLDFTQALDGQVHAVIGGLVATNAGMIEKSRADIALDIAGENLQSLGGLAGSNYGTISESYSEGKLRSTITSQIGGLVSFNFGIVKNSYSLTAIDNPAPAGGLMQMNQGRVSSSYASGKIRQVPKETGGIVSVERTQNRGLANCYWNLDDGVSDPSAAVGNIADYPGGTGLTTAQLQSGLPDGFDPKIWAENPAVNKGLPYLLSNPPAK